MPAQLSGLCWGDGGTSLGGFLRYQGLCHHQGSRGRCFASGEGWGGAGTV